jgi:hypothetical protein
MFSGVDSSDLINRWFVYVFHNKNHSYLRIVFSLQEDDMEKSSSCLSAYIDANYAGY